MAKLAAILVLLCPVVWAADPPLHTARPGSSANQIYVQFETPNALSDCDVEFPRNSSCSGPAPSIAPWAVVVFDGLGNPVVATVSTAKDSLGNLQANGVVTITLGAPIPATFSRVDVTFTRGKAPHASFTPKTPSRNHWISPSKTKDDSDVYISGTFAPAEGTSPSYTIDSKGKYVLKSFGRNGSSTLSATGDVSTDNKKTADPDSFHWSIPVQHVWVNNSSVQWGLLGMELDKKANAINLVSAPSATWAFVHNFYVKDTAHGSLPRVSASFELDFSGGLEFGDNVRNDFAVVNKTSSGEGWFLRGVPSTTASLVVPRILRLNRISVSSSYTGRIPTSDELFLETRNQKKPVPLLTSQTRLYVENNLQFMFTDYIGMQIKHKYGSLPPAFSFVNNSGAVGLVIAFKQTRVP
jgi:hypothetical protein